MEFMQQIISFYCKNLEKSEMVLSYVQLRPQKFNIGKQKGAVHHTILARNCLSNELLDVLSCGNLKMALNHISCH